MGNALISLIVSTLLLVLLIVLFEYEKKRGTRVLERIRSAFDMLIFKISHAGHVVSHFFRRDYVHQTSRYLLNAALAFCLSILKRFEDRVQFLMRANRAMARAARKARAERNKLDEVMEHKLQTALSEEEKRKRKDEVLQGTYM